MIIYLINLSRSSDRLERMQELCVDAGLELARVEGVDGRELSADDIDKVVVGESRWGKLTPGEVGCFLGHRKCWEALVKEGAQYAVVLEDDVVFGEDVAAVFGSSDWIPKDADIVKLEAADERLYLDTKASSLKNGRRIRRLRTSHFCAAGYVVSLSCAQRLLAASETFSEPVDDFLFNVSSPLFDNLVIYQLEPAICIQQAALFAPDSPERIVSCIEGREKKVRRRLGTFERFVQSVFKRRRSVVNRTLSLIGRRERTKVGFR
ncbi:glycosyltransferase family 25 protein [Nitratireductor sp.]|uniref:glycosyltransferase family 25 protein n=1 Tax=Nitratireductor sp. TaxID=1872084 RepID=UPI0025F14995|nr:glycosyltransferase family 25 protein [Nitratireductor sp.]